MTDKTQSVPDSENLWNEFHGRLRQFVSRRVHSAADVDDILQNVFLRIHSKLDGLRSLDRIESWIFQLTRNLITDHFRHAKSYQDLGSEIANDRTDDSEIATSELAGCMKSFIDQLPRDQRTALSLYELQGVSQKEIADQESISLSGAKSRIQRGRQSLKKLLRECCEFQFDRQGNLLAFEPIRSNGCDNPCC